MTLGVLLSGSFLSAWILRRPAERLFVLSVSGPDQPGRQFFVDMAVVLAAGCTLAMFNYFFWGFPLSGSGFKLVVGYSAIGFFIALDMALSREKDVILTAFQQNHHPEEPLQLSSMTRKFSMVAVTAAVFIAILIVLVISQDFAWLAEISRDAGSISRARTSVIYEVFFVVTIILGLVINLIFSFSRNLKLLFDNETLTLERVSRGDLSRMVPVATNDEFGVIARHTNAMIHGLKHRIKLLGALKMAEELQENFLPRRTPAYPGIDISGRIIYCYETGGDYYDYLDLPEGKLGVVIADASDHGVGSALFMSSARAFLLSEITHYQGPIPLVTEVNRYLTRDSGHTGRFITLLFMEINTAKKTLRWIRAGHEPAWMYDPFADTFNQITGSGMALGVLDAVVFTENICQSWSSGSVLILLTDGIREARNKQDEMFGLDRVHAVVRRHAGDPAATIQNRILQSLEDFQDDLGPEDDLCLVVIKLL